jgi:hypothetical protein
LVDIAPPVHSSCYMPGLRGTVIQVPESGLDHGYIHGYIPVILRKMVNIMKEDAVKLFQFQGFGKANVPQHALVECVISILKVRKQSKHPPSISSLTWLIMNIL